MKYYIGPPSMNPISRLAAAFIATVALVGAFIFGLVVLLVLAGVFSLFAMVFYLWSWRLGRTAAGMRGTRSGAAAEGEVIEAEYKVVSRRRN